MAQICRDVAAEPYSEGSLDLSHLAAFISGGESVPVKTGVEFSDLLQQFGARRNVLRPGFGMTETCVRISFNSSTLGSNLIGIPRPALFMILKRS